MSDAPLYDSLDEYSSASPEISNLQDQTQLPEHQSLLGNKDEYGEVNLKKSNSIEIASIPLCSRQYNVAVVRNRLSRRRKRRLISKIPVLSRRSTIAAIPQLLSQQAVATNCRVAEWLQRVEIENEKQESISEKETSIMDQLLSNMSSMSLNPLSNTGIKSSHTMISLNSQSSAFKSKGSCASWVPPIRRTLSYLGQYRMRKLSKENNRLFYKSSEVEYAKSIFEDKSNRRDIEKDNSYEQVIANDGKPEIVSTLPNNASLSTSFMTNTTDGTSLQLFPPSLVRDKPEQSDSKSKSYVPYSVQDYRRLPVPRLGRLGPDLDACREKLDLREKQRAYGQRVSLLNRQRLIMKEKREKLVRCGMSANVYNCDDSQLKVLDRHLYHGRSQHSPPPAAPTSLASPPPPRPVLSPPRPPARRSSASPRAAAPPEQLAPTPVTWEDHVACAENEFAEPATDGAAVATAEAGTAAGAAGAAGATGGTRKGAGRGSPKKAKGRPGRPPPAPRRQAPPRAGDTAAQCLRAMLERHLREREEERAIRDQMASLPPVSPAAVAAAAVSSPRRKPPTRRRARRPKQALPTPATSRVGAVVGTGTRGRRRKVRARRKTCSPPRVRHASSPALSPGARPTNRRCFAPSDDLLPARPPSPLTQAGLTAEEEAALAETVADETVRWSPLPPRPPPPPPPPSYISLSVVDSRDPSSLTVTTATGFSSNCSVSDSSSEVFSVSSMETRPISSPPAFILDDDDGSYMRSPRDVLYAP